MELGSSSRKDVPRDEEADHHVGRTPHILISICSGERGRGDFRPFSFGAKLPAAERAAGRIGMLIVLPGASWTTKSLVDLASFSLEY